MINSTPEYEYKQANTKDIFVDPLYQRDLDNSKVSKIVRDWNPYLVNAVKVSWRDGKLWVFDGQHTIAACKAKRGGRDCMVDCKVFYGLTRLDEMELFIAQNGAATPVKTREKYRALFNNGDPDITAMVRECEMIGFLVDFNPSKARNRILALRTLFTSFKTLDSESFRDMMLIIKEAWGGMPESLTSEIISGMTRFYMAYKGDFNRKRLIKRLAQNSPVAIIRDGKVTASSGASRYARVILGLYNQNTSTGRLDERF